MGAEVHLSPLYPWYGPKDALYLESAGLAGHSTDRQEHARLGSGRFLLLGFRGQGKRGFWEGPWM